MKYIDADRLKAEIERRREKCADIAADERNEDVAEYYRGKEVAYDETSDLITSLQQEQPSLPSNLDEAAFTYENELWESGYKNCGYSTQEVNDAFKAGAEWMAGQGETVEGEIGCAVAHPHENKVIARAYDDYKFGDKVVVQIRKK